jgi:hypothetical protein
MPHEAAYTVRLAPPLAAKMKQLKMHAQLSGTAVLRLLIHRAEAIDVQFGDEERGVLGTQGTEEEGRV